MGKTFFSHHTNARHELSRNKINNWQKSPCLRNALLRVKSTAQFMPQFMLSSVADVVLSFNKYEMNILSQKSKAFDELDLIFITGSLLFHVETH